MGSLSRKVLKKVAHKSNSLPSKLSFYYNSIFIEVEEYPNPKELVKVTKGYQLVHEDCSLTIEVADYPSQEQLLHEGHSLSIEVSAYP